MPTKKSSGTSIIEYTSLKRTHTTTKETSTGMSTESLTNRTLKIYMGAIYVRLIDSRYWDSIKLRFAYI